MTKKIVVLLLSLVAAGAVKANADALDNWQWENPLPEANTFSSVGYGNGAFVAVGEEGTIVNSPDGINWASVNSGTATFTSVAYLNGAYIAVGDAGAIFTSPDGLTWTSQNSGTTGGLSGVAYGNGEYVAVGLSGAILISADGVHWSSANSGTTSSLYGITYADGMFVAVGSGGTILTSPTGTTWTANDQGIFLTLAAVTSGSGTFVAVGDFNTILTSTDGLSWNSENSATTGTNLSCVAYGGGTFAAIDQTGASETSPDGVSWTATASVSGTVSGIAYGNGAFVEVGSAQDADQDTYGAIWRSPNGNAWTVENLAVTYQDLSAMGFGNGTFVAVGNDGTILTSSNGASWAIAAAGKTTSDLYGLVYGSGKFVAVGDDVILTSSDAVTWNLPTLTDPELFQGVAFGSGTFVAVGDGGTIETSTDGMNWAYQSIGGFYDLTGVTYGNGTFVAVGSDMTFADGTYGTTVTSTDGVTWTPENPGTTSILTGITYANGVFVVVGADGVIGTSANGTTWVEDPSGTTNDLNAVTNGDGVFVAAGDNGTLLSSTNGTAWTAEDPSVASPQQLYGIAYGYGTFVAAGSNGTILQSLTLAGLGPVSTTGTVSGITTTAALVSGTVNPNGAATTVSFEYSTSPTLAGAVFTTGSSIGSGSSDVPVSASLTGLTPGQTYYFRVQASNGNGVQYGGIVSFTTIPLPPVITSGSSATGIEGVDFTYQITATNNPASFNALFLPPGLTYNGSTGLISGTVNTTGTFSPTISAINIGGTGSATVTMIILPPKPVITSVLSATGTEGYAFTYQVTASNTPTSYFAQYLPPGVGFSSSTGLISGTPTQTGTFPASISAINTGGTGSATVTMIILPPPPMISSASSETGTDGFIFSYQITASNNPTSFGVAGALPTGVSFSETTGLIFGTPMQTGTFPVTVSASNAGGTGSQPLTVIIVSPLMLPPMQPTITSGTAAAGVGGEAFSYQITATNSPGSFTATGLPAGLSVNNSTGLISGTLAQGGVFPVAIGATNGGGTGFGTVTLTITVNLAGLKGSYDGLAAAGGTNVGLFTVSVTSKGTFTGKLTLPGVHYPLTGKFSNYGTFAGNLNASGAVLTVTLAADPTPPLLGISGTIAATKSAITDTYSVQSGLQGAFSALKHPSGVAGRYTAVIPALSSTDPTRPNGAGYGAMTVGAAGAVILTGKLGDGTPFTAAAQLHADGKTWTLFKLLYAGAHPGSLAAAMTFENLPDSDCNGTVEWIKPAQTHGVYYRNGFSASVAIGAAKYASPPLTAATGNGVLTSGTITLMGGNLPLAINDGFDLFAHNRVTVSGTNEVAVTLAPVAGGISGTFRMPGAPTKTTFTGVIYQKPSPPAAYGLFLGTDQSGGMELSQ